VVLERVQFHFKSWKIECLEIIYHVFVVYEVQDDPVAHTVHYNKKLLDLYLFDHKSISRLNDITYDDVINSDQYAVILFTLECK